MASLTRSSAVYELNAVATCQTFRKKIDEKLNYVAVHAVVVMATVIAVLLATSLLLIDVDVIQDPAWQPEVNCTDSSQCSSPRMELAQDILYVIEAAVLAAFVLENVVRWLIKGICLVRDGWQVFDGLVVVTTFLVYICLTVVISQTTLAFAITHVISLRLWRIGRMYHDVKAAAKWRTLKEAGSAIEARDRLLTHAEQQIRQLQQALYDKKLHIERQHKVICRLKSAASRSLPNDVISTNHVPRQLLPGSTAAAGRHADKKNTNARNQSSRPNNVNSVKTKATVATVRHLANEETPTAAGVADVHSAGDVNKDVQQHINEVETDCSSAQQANALTVFDDSGSPPSLASELTEDTRTVVGRPTIPTFVSDAEYDSVSDNDETDEADNEDDDDDDDDGDEFSSDGSKNSRKSGRPSPNESEPTGKRQALKTDNDQFSYLNKAFVDSLTDEEALEVVRVSHVPFHQYGSSSALSSENIPMTDL